MVMDSWGMHTSGCQRRRPQRARGPSAKGNWEDKGCLQRGMLAYNGEIPTSAGTPARWTNISVCECIHPKTLSGYLPAVRSALLSRLQPCLNCPN